MPQSLIQMYTHIIYSTKHRLPHLDNRELAAEVHAYLAGICRNLDSPSIIVGGASDHVHLLCYLSSGITVREFLMRLKRDSTKWLKRTHPEMNGFYWQAGYGSFSFSPSHVAPLKRYIENQVEHHKKESFQEELRRFLKKYGVKYDEKFVWD